MKCLRQSAHLLTYGTITYGTAQLLTAQLLTARHNYLRLTSVRLNLTVIIVDSVVSSVHHVHTLRASSALCVRQVCTISSWLYYHTSQTSLSSVGTFREHLGLTVALRVLSFVCITKIDGTAPATVRRLDLYTAFILKSFYCPSNFGECTSCARITKCTEVDEYRHYLATLTLHCSIDAGCR